MPDLCTFKKGLKSWTVVPVHQARVELQFGKLFSLICRPKDRPKSPIYGAPGIQPRPQSLLQEVPRPVADQILGHPAMPRPHQEAPRPLLQLEAVAPNSQARPDLLKSLGWRRDSHGRPLPHLLWRQISTMIHPLTKSPCPTYRVCHFLPHLLWKKVQRRWNHQL